MSNTAPRNQEAMTFGYQAPPKPRPTFQGERLWTLRKGPAELACGIVYHVEPLGFDVQVYEDKVFLMSHRWAAKEDAIRFSTTIRADYEADGWTAQE